LADFFLIAPFFFTTYKGCNKKRKIHHATHDGGVFGFGIKKRQQQQKKQQMQYNK
jgi:hypothetical protein